jgi:hypothetical protein
MLRFPDRGVIVLFLFIWGLVIGTAIYDFMAPEDYKPLAVAYAHTLNPPARVIGCQGRRCDIQLSSGDIVPLRCSIRTNSCAVYKE